MKSSNLILSFLFIFFSCSFLSPVEREIVKIAPVKHVLGVPRNVPIMDPFDEQTFGEDSVSEQTQKMFDFVVYKMGCSHSLQLRQMKSKSRAFGAFATCNFVYVNEQTLYALKENDRLFLLANAVAHVMNGDYKKTYLVQTLAKGLNIAVATQVNSLIPGLSFSWKFIGPVVNWCAGLIKFGLVAKYASKPVTNWFYSPVISWLFVRQEIAADALVVKKMPELTKSACGVLERWSKDKHFDSFSRFVLGKRIEAFAKSLSESALKA
ncbi:hypothetical protein HN446_00600 [bacterium]|nr:hypothetical protein [bacterium]